MIKRIKIEGYKSLAEVEVNLKPLSLLFGPNAAGKEQLSGRFAALIANGFESHPEGSFCPPLPGDSSRIVCLWSGRYQGFARQRERYFLHGSGRCCCRNPLSKG